MMPDDGHLHTAGSSSSETGVLDGHGLLVMSMYEDTCILASGRTVDWWGSRRGGGVMMMNRRRDHNQLVERRLLLVGIVEGLKINVAERRQQERVVEARQCSVGR
jgi:hypothetical protein